MMKKITAILLTIMLLVMIPAAFAGAENLKKIVFCR